MTSAPRTALSMSACSTHVPDFTISQPEFILSRLSRTRVSSLSISWDPDIYHERHFSVLPAIHSGFNWLMWIWLVDLVHSTLHRKISNVYIVVRFIHVPVHDVRIHSICFIKFNIDFIQYSEWNLGRGTESILNFIKQMLCIRTSCTGTWINLTTI